MRFERPSLSPLAVLLAATLLGACDRPPSPTREWTPQDHDRSDEKEKVASGAQAAPQAKGSAGGEDDGRMLAEMTWRQQCLACHGPIGRGDGPNGPMVKASDLTLEAWQAKVTDAEIATSIKQGKGKMPKFDLPDSVVAGLVGRIRAMRGR